MPCYILLLLLGLFELSLPVPRGCKPEELCLPVPSNVCDNSLCLPVNVTHLNKMTMAGMKRYSWNIARSTVNNFCPWKREIIIEDYSTLTAPGMSVFPTNSGVYCNITTTHSEKVSLTFDPDTKLATIFTQEYDGVTYEGCYLYYEPDTSCIYRKCRVDGSSQKCATVNIFEAASGNCDRSKLIKFAQGLGMEYPQITTDCF